MFPFDSIPFPGASQAHGGCPIGINGMPTLPHFDVIFALEKDYRTPLRPAGYLKALWRTRLI
jgi:hypothetical protein